MTPHPSYSTECTRPTRYICSFTFHLYVPPPPLLKLTGLGSMEGRVGAMLSTIDLGASGSYIARFLWAPLMGRVH